MNAPTCISKRIDRKQLLFFLTLFVDIHFFLYIKSLKNKENFLILDMADIGTVLVDETKLVPTDNRRD